MGVYRGMTNLGATQSYLAMQAGPAAQSQSRRSSIECAGSPRCHEPFRSIQIDYGQTFGVAETVFLVNRVFVPCQKGAVLTKMAKMTNFGICVLPTESRGFAPQTPENDENERKRRIKLRKILGTPAGCPWDTRRDKQGSIGRCPMDFLLFTIEQLTERGPFAMTPAGCPRDTWLSKGFQKFCVIISCVPSLVPKSITDRFLSWEKLMSSCRCRIVWPEEFLFPLSPSLTHSSMFGVRERGLLEKGLRKVHFLEILASRESPEGGYCSIQIDYRQTCFPGRN